MRLLFAVTALLISLAVSGQAKLKVFQVEPLLPGQIMVDRDGNGFNERGRLLAGDVFVPAATVTGQTGADTTALAIFSILEDRINQAVAGSVADLSVTGGNLSAGGDPVAVTTIAPIQSVQRNGVTLTPDGNGRVNVLDEDTQLTEAQVDAFVNNNGYLTTEADGSTTNELQDPTYNATTGVFGLTSSAETVDLSPLKNRIPRIDVDAFTATAGQTAFTLPTTPTEGEMYLRNGLPIPENQWSRSGTTLTLSVSPALNAGEVIGYDYRE